MIKAQHQLLDQQGGYLVVENQKVQANALLNVGGIISDQPLDCLAKDLCEVRKAMEHLGYIMIMRLCLFQLYLYQFHQN